MCLSVPARVTGVAREVGWIADGAGERPISLVAVPDVAVGDYIVHHAGLALERVDPAEAAAMLALLAEIEQDDPADGTSSVEGAMTFEATTGQANRGAGGQSASLAGPLRFISLQVE